MRKELKVGREEDCFAEFEDGGVATPAIVIDFKERGIEFKVNKQKIWELLAGMSHINLFMSSTLAKALQKHLGNMAKQEAERNDEVTKNLKKAGEMPRTEDEEQRANNCDCRWGKNENL